jgi:hypothetical protein
LCASTRPGQRLLQRVEARVVLGERLARRFALRALRVGVGLLVDREQQVEGVEQEVPAAAGRVEHAQVARVLLRARRELLAGLADHVLALLGEHVLVPRISYQMRPSVLSVRNWTT